MIVTWAVFSRTGARIAAPPNPTPGIGEGFSMGRMDFTPKSFRRNAGMEIPTAMREAFAVLVGVPGGGFTGARSRSQ